MNLVKLFSRGVGVATILASGIAFADDVVRVDILPGSSIRLGVNVVAFGQDPPTSTLNNVSITDDGTGVGSLLVARNDISFAPIDLVVSFYTVHAELRAQSDLIGTYDRRSGWLTAAGDFDLKLTSNAPGSNNSTCIIPATTLAISTDDAGGWSFVSGKGTAVDNTFSVNAVPHGRCGSYVAFDYADLLNVNLSLPSRSGANTLALVMRMTPPLAPDQASDRIITSIAGDGVRRFAGDGAPATSASLYDPTGVAVDNSGNVFVADYNNHRIRRVDAITGIITTVAGNGAQGFSGDGGLA